LQRAVLSGALGQWEPSESQLRELFLDPPAGSLEARWHVYATGLVARAAEAIENDFPALARVLGTRPLRSLASRYTRRSPPRSYDLGRIGDRLAEFLAGDALAGDLPFLPDLARLEWAIAEAFVCRDEPPLRWDDLARLGAEAVADTPLQLHPAARLVRSDWPVYDIWACRERPESEVDVPLHGRPCRVLVTRRGLDVVCRVLDETSLAVAEAAAAEERLVDILERRGVDPALVTAALRDLTENGGFARPAEGPLPADAVGFGGPRRE
jgi:hypothetical protein